MGDSVDVYIHCLECDSGRIIQLSAEDEDYVEHEDGVTWGTEQLIFNDMNYGMLEELKSMAAANIIFGAHHHSGGSFGAMLYASCGDGVLHMIGGDFDCNPVTRVWFDHSTGEVATHAAGDDSVRDYFLAETRIADLTKKINVIVKSILSTKEENMGQYYVIVNLDKKEFIKPHTFGDGAKLMEFSSGGMIMCVLAVLLSEGSDRGGGDLHSENGLLGSWARDKIVVAGDYADAETGSADNLYQILQDTPPWTDISLKCVDLITDDSWILEALHDRLGGLPKETAKIVVAKCVAAKLIE